jgi:hypothetical protein
VVAAAIVVAVVVVVLVRLGEEGMEGEPGVGGLMRWETPGRLLGWVEKRWEAGSRSGEERRRRAEAEEEERQVIRAASARLIQRLSFWSAVCCWGFAVARARARVCVCVCVCVVCDRQRGSKLALRF